MMDLKTLRKIEEEYKNFYQGAGRTIDFAISPDDFYNLINNSDEKASFSNYHIRNSLCYTEALIEDEYFQESQHISALQHIRYLPPMIHTHDFFEVACILSGTFTNYIGDQKLLLHAGDIMILAPDTKHAVCTYQDDGIMINILIRSSTFEHNFLNLLPENDILYGFFVKVLYGNTNTPYLLFHTGEKNHITEYAVHVLQECRRNQRYKNTMITSLMSIFFVKLLREHEKDIVIPTLKSSIMNENTIFIIEYMQKNYATITLSHLAGFFNYSDRQMLRIIKAATGMSFNENIKKIRMNHAKEFLAHSDLTVREISNILGYYDASNFRKVFKSYFGVTPQEYREFQKKNVLS